jgi:polyisoprenoid-binding protein YceI
MTTLQELLGGPGLAGVWNLVPDRADFGFKNKTMWGLMNVKGTFGEASGDGQVTAAGAIFGRIDIRAASLKTGIRKRDEHLRSADFFDVEKFPEISVVVTGAQPTGPETADLRATLTVKGTSAPIELPATVRMLDDGTVRVSAQTTIERSKFGVTGNQLGMVGMNTTIFGDAVFVRAPQ